MKITQVYPHFVQTNSCLYLRMSEDIWLLRRPSGDYKELHQNNSRLLEEEEFQKQNEQDFKDDKYA